MRTWNPRKQRRPGVFLCPGGDGDAKETQETVQLPRLSPADGGTLLRGTQEAGGQAVRQVQSRQGGTEDVREQRVEEDPRQVPCCTSTLRTVQTGRPADKGDGSTPYPAAASRRYA